MSLDKVTVEELQEQIHPTDSSANAAFLFKTGKVSFKLSSQGLFSLVEEVVCKIKIYKKGGYDYANVEIPFYTGGKNIKLYFSDAATYNLVDGKVVKTKLKSDGEFEEKVTEDFSLKKITLPNVKEGSIIEYRYVLDTPYYNYFPDWYFQHEIPVNYVQYTVLIPQYFSYQSILKGYEKINMSKQQTVTSYNNRYNEAKIVYDASNIKAIKEESYVNNMDNYTSMLQYELATTSFPGQNITNYATDWISVAKSIYDSDAFGKEMTKTSFFEADLETLLKGVVSRDARIDTIFNYVKNRMNWNEKNGYYSDLGLKNAYTEKIGNAADINLLLVSMLRKAQIKSNPILVSTRSNGVPLFPNRGAFNYVIAGVELDNKILLLDATTKNAMPDIVPIQVLNWKGRLIREDETSVEVDLTPKFNSKEITYVVASIEKDAKVKGKIRKQYYDYNSYIFREVYGKLSEGSYLENFERKNPGLYVENYALTNEKDLSKPVIELYDFSTDNAIESIGDKMYVSPMLFFADKSNPFTQETRLYPIDFTYPFQDRFTFTLSIPEGYEIESLPKSLAMNLEQNIANFKYTIEAKGSTIQLAVSSEINYINVQADFYNALKMYFKQMIEKQNEKIVLKKI